MRRQIRSARRAATLRTVPPFVATLIAALAAGFAAEALGLAFPVVLIVALAAGLAADRLARRSASR